MKTVTTADDLVSKAELLGWTVRPDGSLRGITLLRGEFFIVVGFTAAGGINNAEKYRFFRVDELQLVERLSGRFKREKLLAWLAED